MPESDGRSVGDSLDMDEEGRKSVTFLGASPRGKSLSVYFHKQCMVSDTHGFPLNSSFQCITCPCVSIFRYLADICYCHFLRY